MKKEEDKESEPAPEEVELVVTQEDYEQKQSAAEAAAAAVRSDSAAVGLARLNLEYGAAPAIQLTAELCPAHRVELNELVLKKLKRRSAPTRLEHTWEAVRQDDGKVMAQRVYVIDGKQSRDGGEFGRYNVTKWVDEPGVGSGDGASA